MTLTATNIKSKIFTALKSLVVLTVIVTFTSPVLTSALTLEQNLDQIRAKLEAIKQQKASINKTISSEKEKQGALSNEIKIIASERDLLQNEVNEKELIIQELNLQIEILTGAIAENTTQIETTRVEVEKLDVVAQEQLSEIYFDQKTANTGITLFLTKGNTNVVKTGLYQQTIQRETNSNLTLLKDKSDELRNKVDQLNTDKIKVVSDKSQIDVEKAALDAKKAELQASLSKLQTLYNAAQRSIEASKKADAALSSQESQLRAQQELVMQEILQRAPDLRNAQFVLAGTILGYQGLTGLTSGYHLHFGVATFNTSTRRFDSQNPCNYLPGGVISVCTGNGQMQWPLRGTFYWTSPYGYRSFGGSTSFHAAIDIAHPVQNAPVYAAHSGYYRRGFQPCSGSWCRGGGANYAELCEKARCDGGFKTIYYHLK